MYCLAGFALAPDLALACDRYFVQLDNDFTLLQDEGYTNGLRLGCLIESEDPSTEIELMVGHNIHTPNNISRESIDPDDQPYAGYLFGQAAWLTKRASALTRYEIQFGLVGPAAGGEPAQKLIHEVGHFAEPRGWDHQLDNELMINARIGRMWRLTIDEAARFGHMLPFGWAALGSVMTAAGFGGIWQFGSYSETAYPRMVGYSEPPGTADSRLQDGEYFVFVGIDGRMVAHDVFLDGNLTSNSHSIDSENVVGNLRFGVQRAWNDVNFGFVQTLHTPLFDGDDPHGYGSFFVALPF